jgi:uncharacterized membrane protein
MDPMEFFSKYKWRILGVIFAVIFTILVFTINFWRTLLLFVIVGVAYFIGTLMDEGGRERVREFFRSLFGHRGS